MENTGINILEQIYECIYWPNKISVSKCFYNYKLLNLKLKFYNETGIMSTVDWQILGTPILLEATWTHVFTNMPHLKRKKALRPRCWKEKSEYQHTRVCSEHFVQANGRLLRKDEAPSAHVQCGSEPKKNVNLLRIYRSLKYNWRRRTRIW